MQGGGDFEDLEAPVKTGFYNCWVVLSSLPLHWISVLIYRIQLLHQTVQQILLSNEACPIPFLMFFSSSTPCFVQSSYFLTSLFLKQDVILTVLVLQNQAFNVTFFIPLYTYLQFSGSFRALTMQWINNTHFIENIAKCNSPKRLE